MHVSLLAAISIDGFIAPADAENQRSFNWTSQADKAFYVSHIKSADVIVMGAKTFMTFSRYPKHSRWMIYTSRPTEFINPKPDVIRAEGTGKDPQELLAQLQQQGVEKVAICGGASVYQQFIESNLVDTLYITVEPIVFGSGVKLFGDRTSIQSKWSLVKVEKLGEEGTVLLEYSRQL